MLRNFPGSTSTARGPSFSLAKARASPSLFMVAPQFLVFFVAKSFGAFAAKLLQVPGTSEAMGHDTRHFEQCRT
jgi:hypothetical protein